MPFWLRLRRAGYFVVDLFTTKNSRRTQRDYTNKTIEPQDFPRDFAPLFHFAEPVVQCTDIVLPKFYWGGCSMIKTLTKHGNSYALVIDKPILDLLKIRPDTPLSISTDGKSLRISPDGEDDIDDDQFQEILDGINQRYSKVFQKLAE
jgi:antitoxin component of MazEF toxin-antitoxin module